jgi:peroxiredoxin
VLKVGTIAPEIDALATDGRKFVLSRQEGLCTIIYFYPAAFTPFCTAETKRFRDNYPELALAGATLVGVSPDDGATQCRFAESLKTPFPLLADPDRRISTEYDVVWPIVRWVQRVTYVISWDRVVLAAFHHELFGLERHRDDVLRFVHALRDGVPALG